MEISDPLTRQVHIKMSGCPNGCAQHHVADIGFYGASIKVGEHTIPAYIPHVGGNYEGAPVAFGQRLKLRLPAKRVPEAIERWVRHYEANRSDGEEWNAFVGRVGTGELEALFKETLDTWRAFEERFGVKIDVQDASSPDRPWTGPEHCCSAAKIAALDAGLAGAEGWITGIRREQGPTRANAQPIERDDIRGLWKYNPLADWTEKDLW